MIYYMAMITISTVDFVFMRENVQIGVGQAASLTNISRINTFF